MRRKNLSLFRIFNLLMCNIITYLTFVSVAQAILFPFSRYTHLRFFRAVPVWQSLSLRIHSTLRRHKITNILYLFIVCV